MSRTIHQTIAATALLALSAACSSADRPVQAHDTGADAIADIERLGQTQVASGERYADQNKDGHVTRDEARADPKLTRSFDRYDRNRDGQLDRAEFARLEKHEPAEDERAQLRPRREFPRSFD